VAKNITPELFLMSISDPPDFVSCFPVIGHYYQPFRTAAGYPSAAAVYANAYPASSMEMYSTVSNDDPKFIKELSIYPFNTALRACSNHGRSTCSCQYGHEWICWRSSRNEWTATGWRMKRSGA
jgi:hypothetical protein